MVRYENILKVIAEYTVKCPTIAEMRQKLSQYTYEEQLDQLKSQDLLNPLEIEDYESKLKEWNQMNLIDDAQRTEAEHDENSREYYYGWFKPRKQYLEQELFTYGRKLIEGEKPRNPVPQIDKGIFKKDTQYTAISGEMEERQISYQKDNLKINASYEWIHNEDGTHTKHYVGEEWEYIRAMDSYFDGDIENLNISISNKKYLNKLTNEQRKDIKLIDTLIDRSPGLLENTIFFRTGHFDPHLREGDHSKGFKGYQSASYQESGANMYMGNMKMVIYAPKGTKGIVGNDDRFLNATIEHEYLLPRNTGFTVLSIDYENHMVEILLDND